MFGHRTIMPNQPLPRAASTSPRPLPRRSRASTGLVGTPARHAGGLEPKACVRMRLRFGGTGAGDARSDIDLLVARAPVAGEPDPRRRSSGLADVVSGYAPEFLTVQLTTRQQPNGNSRSVSCMTLSAAGPGTPSRSWRCQRTSGLVTAGGARLCSRTSTVTPCKSLARLAGPPSSARCEVAMPASRTASCTKDDARSRLRDCSGLLARIIGKSARQARADTPFARVLRR
jgi:hypothetical protein